MRNFTYDKTAFSIHKLGEEPKAYTCWLQQAPEARIAAIEFLREQYHSKDELQSRLQRVYRVVKLTQP